MNLSVMAQHRKDSFEKGFGMISAWCWSLAPKGANLTGFNIRMFPLWLSTAKTHSRRIL